MASHDPLMMSAHAPYSLRRTMSTPVNHLYFDEFVGNPDDPSTIAPDMLLPLNINSVTGVSADSMFNFELSQETLDELDDSLASPDDLTSGTLTRVPTVTSLSDMEQHTVQQQQEPPQTPVQFSGSFQVPMARSVSVTGMAAMGAPPPRSAVTRTFSSGSIYQNNVHPQQFATFHSTPVQMVSTPQQTPVHNTAGQQYTPMTSPRNRRQAPVSAKSQKLQRSVTIGPPMAHPGSSAGFMTPITPSTDSGKFQPTPSVKMDYPVTPSSAPGSAPAPAVNVKLEFPDQNTTRTDLAASSGMQTPVTGYNPFYKPLPFMAKASPNNSSPTTPNLAQAPPSHGLRSGPLLPASPIVAGNQEKAKAAAGLALSLVSSGYAPAPGSLSPYEDDDPKEKPHLCLQCHKRFRRMEHLKRHQKVHTDERPFPCRVVGCTKRFSRSDNLRAHEKTHTKQGGRNKYVEGLEVPGRRPSTKKMKDIN